MAYQTISGGGLWLPYPLSYTGYLMSFANVGPIDATGEKLACVGRVYIPGGGSKTVTGVGFLAGPISSAGGSMLDISLQDVALASGVPARPDGTKDQVVNVSLSALSASPWNSVTFGSTRSVTHGDLLAIVWEYDSGGRLGSDYYYNALPQRDSEIHSALACLYTSSWATVPQSPNCILNCDDGSAAWLDGSFVATSISPIAINSDTTPDEVALRFRLPVPCVIDGLLAYFGTTGSIPNVDVVLYDAADTSMVTVSVDGDTLLSANNGIARRLFLPIASTTLSANTTYRLALKPTTDTSINMYGINVKQASHLALHGGGMEWYWSQRTNGGAWSDTTTRRPAYMGIRFAQLDDGTGSGTGGLLRHPGMAGGING